MPSKKKKKKHEKRAVGLDFVINCELPSLEGLFGDLYSNDICF